MLFKTMGKDTPFDGGTDDYIYIEGNFDTENGSTVIRHKNNGGSFISLNGVTKENLNNLVISNTSTQDALSYAVRAEAARDAANTTARVYASTGAGIAATTNGQIFSVLSADLLYLISYSNTSGVAVEVTRIFTKNYFDSFVLPATYSSRSGYIFAIKDLAKRIGIALRTDGTLIAKLALIAGSGVSVTRDSTGAYTIASTVVDNTVRYRHVTTAFKDVNNRFVGFLRNGEIQAKMPIEVESNLATDGTISAWIARDTAYIAWLYTQDSLGVVRKITGFSKISSLRIVNSKVVIFGKYLGDFDYWQMNVDGTSIYKAISRKGIACWGDSLTAGSGATSAGSTSYPPRLFALLNDREVRNYGLGGQVSSQIVYRQGGNVGTCIVSGDTIPASGGVTLTAFSILPFSPATSGTLDCTIAGIDGTLTLASSVYTFTRKSAGSSLVVSNPVALAFNNYTADEMINGFWIGQNDGGSSAAILPALAAGIANIKPLIKRFFVMNVTGTSTDVLGSANQIALLASNEAVRLVYPNNHIDIRSILVAAYNPAIPQDVTDHTNNVIPSSLRSDTVHLNDAGYLIVATAVRDFITAKGW